MKNPVIEYRHKSPNATIMIVLTLWVVPGLEVPKRSFKRPTKFKILGESMVLLQNCMSLFYQKKTITQSKARNFVDNRVKKSYRRLYLQVILNN